MGFTRRSMERISQVVQTVEGMRLNDRPSRAGSPVVVVPEIRVVRITSTTLVDDRYPAELLDRDPVTGVWDSFDPAVVVHVEPLDGETLTEGILDCRRSGETDDGVSIFTPIKAAATGGISHRYCRAATTVNGTLATAFDNASVIDGVTLATGDRILVKDQSSPAENGIYIVNASGAPTRADDADSWDELVAALVVVSEGTANADSLWLCTSNAGGTLGSTSVTWAEKYPNASATESGIVTTATQTLAGIKTFPDGIVTDHITLDTVGGLADIIKVTDFATETIHLASSDGTYTITAILNANGAGGISGGELRLVASGWGTTFPQLYLQNAAATVRLGQTGTYGGLQITSGLITGGAVSVSGSEISGGTIDGGTW